MKSLHKSLLLAGCLLFAGSARAEDVKESKVPAAVRAAYKSKYASLPATEWEWKKKEGQYKAEFMRDGREYEAYFTTAGKWLYTESDLKNELLPQPIKDYIAGSKYAGWELDDVEERSSPEHSLFYKVEVEQGNDEMNLYFLANGTLIKEEVDH